jgi:hypothetical protein
MNLDHGRHKRREIRRVTRRGLYRAKPKESLLVREKIRIFNLNKIRSLNQQKRFNDRRLKEGFSTNGNQFVD